MPKEPGPFRRDEAGLVGRQAARCRSCKPEGWAEEPDIRAATGRPRQEASPRPVSCPTPSPPHPLEEPAEGIRLREVAGDPGSPAISISAHGPGRAKWPLRKGRQAQRSTPFRKLMGLLLGQRRLPWAGLQKNQRLWRKGSQRGSTSKLPSPKPPRRAWAKSPGHFRGPPAPRDTARIVQPAAGVGAAEGTRPGCFLQTSGQLSSHMTREPVSQGRASRGRGPRADPGGAVNTLPGVPHARSGAGRGGAAPVLRSPQPATKRGTDGLPAGPKSGAVSVHAREGF